jgi:hypothetical protein
MSLIALTADLAQPNDPSLWSSISGAQLLQQVTGATLYTDKGSMITTTDSGATPQVPDAATYTTGQRYLWRRITAATCIIYYWNPSATSDATYLKWTAFQTIPLSQIRYSQPVSGYSVAGGSGNQWNITDAGTHDITKGTLMFSKAIVALNSGTYFRARYSGFVSGTGLASNSHAAIAVFNGSTYVGGNIVYIPGSDNIIVPINVDIIGGVSANVAGTSYTITARFNFLKTNTDSTGTAYLGRIPTGTIAEGQTATFFVEEQYIIN